MSDRTSHRRVLRFAVTSVLLGGAVGCTSHEAPKGEGKTEAKPAPEPTTVAPEPPPRDIAIDAEPAPEPEPKPRLNTGRERDPGLTPSRVDEKAEKEKRVHTGPMPR